MRRIAQVIAVFAALYYLGVGLWAFAAPRSFFFYVAPYPPYNEHFLHDLGAFTLGLGAAALAGLVFADAMTAVLTGVAVASVMHEVSHITDRLLGGRPSDPYTVGAVALIVLAGLFAAARAVSPRASSARPRTKGPTC